jgi:hypothetical protein
MRMYCGRIGPNVLMSCGYVDLNIRISCGLVGSNMRMICGNVGSNISTEPSQNIEIINLNIAHSFFPKKFCLVSIKL